MKPYQSKSGKKSGVVAYSAGADHIFIRFSSGAAYKYTYESAGERTVETMKELADRQEGLSRYISFHQPGYE